MKIVKRLQLGDNQFKVCYWRGFTPSMSRRTREDEVETFPAGVGDHWDRNWEFLPVKELLAHPSHV